MSHLIRALRQAWDNTRAPSVGVYTPADELALDLSELTDQDLRDLLQQVQTRQRPLKPDERESMQGTQKSMALQTAIVDTRFVSDEVKHVVSQADIMVWTYGPGIIAHGTAQLYPTDLPPDQPIGVWWLPIETFVSHCYRSSKDRYRDADVLKSTLLKMRETSPWVYLMIAGIARPVINGETDEISVGTYATPTSQRQAQGLSWGAFQGRVQTLQEIGVVVTFGHQDSQFVSDLERLARHSRRPVKIEPVRDALFLTPQEVVLTQIRGIGQERAETLLKRLGALSVVLECLTTPLTRKITNGKHGKGVSSHHVVKPEELSDIPENVFRHTRDFLGLPDGVGLYITNRMNDPQNALDELDVLTADLQQLGKALSGKNDSYDVAMTARLDQLIDQLRSIRRQFEHIKSSR